MPANLTADYLAAEQSFKQAQTTQEKIAALEEMLATLPKHKGTEKLHADIRRRLSQARKESQRKGGSHATPAYLVRREGAGQVVLVGPPNSGKSQIVAALTHARPEVADYPFTTHLPVAGMMPFQDVQIQLVDLPAMSAEFAEPWMPQVIRMANLSVLVAAPSDPDVLGEIEFILATFEQWRLAPPALLVANKLDLPGAAEDFAIIRDMYCDRLKCIGISAASGLGLDEFAGTVFAALDVVRFYSKPPGKKADLDRPYILRRGETVQDAAAKVHRDFAEHLHFARLFRLHHEQDGLMVERTHVVEDQDILEFHAA
jgi:ribosome-interacting GTPase 1